MAEAAAPQGNGPMKLTITHHRKPEHTHEAFMKWIVEKHVPLAVPVFKKHGIIGYSLFDTPGSLNGALEQEMKPMRPTWDFADFDCVTEYTLPDVQTIRSLTADPDFAASIADQEDWVDTAKAMVSLGHCTPYLLESGEVMNVAGA
ncbi:Uu.00g043690.m01.CDS01 [Anthostomella pinea]|uniref:Uu.00g043690.m01.CDS01 n=1 Tax=Anthostomella pinea TaxID=933095 RepID=A0AAI8VAU3_9PEZI|nr:Uu.00g043690.m01.CDS01 [Anthostomella pinea]